MKFISNSLLNLINNSFPAFFFFCDDLLEFISLLPFSFYDLEQVITFSCLILLVGIHDDEAEKSSTNVNLDNHIARSSTQRYVSTSRAFHRVDTLSHIALFFLIQVGYMNL